MSVEGVFHDRRAPGGGRGSASLEEFSLTSADVLAFLFELRADERRCHGLNSGPRLVDEAIEIGLVDPSEQEALFVELVELRASGLVDWEPGRHDARGDDVLHAAEFHLTAQGRRRLRAAGAVTA